MRKSAALAGPKSNPPMLFPQQFAKYFRLFSRKMRTATLRPTPKPSEFVGRLRTTDPAVEEEWRNSMCDYSLHGVANRPAKVGDKLVSTNFVNSFTRGFTEMGEPKVAVFLMHGTELAFEHEVEVDQVFRRILPRFVFGKSGQTVARFRQINMDRPDTHHDALEFPNGKVVLV